MDRKLKDMFENIQKTASYVADNAAQKGKEIYETSKSSVKILEIRGQIDSLYKEIGKLVYQSQQGEDISQDLIVEKVNEITGKYAEIEQLSEKKDNIKHTVVCKNCQVIGRKDDVFCTNCGTKL